MVQLYYKIYTLILFQQMEGMVHGNFILTMATLNKSKNGKMVYYFQRSPFIETLRELSMKLFMVKEILTLVRKLFWTTSGQLIFQSVAILA